MNAELCFFSSIVVTEDEIQHGIIKAKDPALHTYWFRRNITDLKEHIADPVARNFIDKLGAENLDGEAVSFTEDLKTTKIPSVLPDVNVNNYDITWSAEHGVDPSGMEEHKAYLDRLCVDFYSVLKQMIENGIKVRFVSKSYQLFEYESPISNIFDHIFLSLSS